MNVVPFLKKIEKPWGYELIFTDENVPVTAKLLHIKAGSRISLQYHEEKEETMVLINGEASIIYGETKDNLKEEKLEKFKGYFVSKGLIHRFMAITDCEIFESSTREAGVTVRLQDDYQRGNENDESRKNRIEGKTYMG